MPAGPRCSTSSRWPDPQLPVRTWAAGLCRSGTKTAEATARYNALSARSRPLRSAWLRSPCCAPTSSTTPRPARPMWPTARPGIQRNSAQHEEEILLHQAAKEAFNELNVKEAAHHQGASDRVRPAVGGQEKGLRRVPAGPRHHAGAADGQEQCGSGPGDGADRTATERKRPRPAVSWSRSKAFVRTRSHRLKICVQRGLGGLPSTSAWGYLDSHRHRLPLSLQK